MTNELPPLPNDFQIVSGGQTGVDRAALDAAIETDIPHGGWCPKGRLAEDGPIEPHYALQETKSAKYPARTEQNVIDSCGTLILYTRRLQGGTLLTQRLAKKHNKPLLLVNFADHISELVIREWINANDVHVLNIAGSRESTSPGIFHKAKAALLRILA
ncbi:MAG: hypothetical protein ACI9HK_001772 [Pirellulaceae bacterium]|jgi:hypothetical protein